MMKVETNLKQPPNRDLARAMVEQILALGGATHRRAEYRDLLQRMGPEQLRRELAACVREEWTTTE